MREFVRGPIFDAVQRNRPFGNDRRVCVTTFLEAEAKAGGRRFGPPPPNPQCEQTRFLFLPRHPPLRILDRQSANGNVPLINMIGSVTCRTIGPAIYSHACVPKIYP